MAKSASRPPGAHRSASRQTNKPFKGKRRVSKASFGVKTPTTSPAVMSGAARRQAAKSERTRRLAAAQIRRNLGSADSLRVPPICVMLLPLHREIDPTPLKAALASHGELIYCAGGEPTAPGVPVNILLPPWAQTSTVSGRKQCLTLIDSRPYDFFPGSKDSRVSPEMDDVGSSSYKATEGAGGATFPPQAMNEMLDVAKAANVVLCLFPETSDVATAPFDEFGYTLMTALKVQGLPTPIGVILPDRRDLIEGGAPGSSSARRRSEKLSARFFHSEFGPEAKVLSLGGVGVKAETDKAKEKALLRLCANAAPKEFSWRAIRGYLVPDRVELSDGRLLLEGYARGLGFTVRHPVHMTGIGDFVLERIVALKNPLCARRLPGRGSLGLTDVEADGSEIREIESLTPEKAAELEEEWLSSPPPDPFAAEQTWPSEEELGAGRAARSEGRESENPAARAFGKHVISVSHLENGVATLHENVGETLSDDQEHGLGGPDISDVDSSAGAPEIEANLAEGVNTDDDAWDSELDCAEGGEECVKDALDVKNRRGFELEERSAEDRDFPDEVDIMPGQKARERLARYRGLKTPLMQADWDCYEGLPPHYARIFQFESYHPTLRFARGKFLSDCLDEGGSTTTGRYVQLTLRMPSELTPTKRQSLGRLLTHTGGRCLSVFTEEEAYNVSTHGGDCPPSVCLISTLLPFERKITVQHLHLTRQSHYQEPIRSKTTLDVSCGFRRFECRPLFSRGRRGASLGAAAIGRRKNNISKMDRFFHPGIPVIASIYAPVMFPPAPVLAFARREGSCGQSSLAAWGSVVGPDPLRVIVKRIVLTGHAFRVHKNRAVVRFMFFTPEDVRWFQPVELFTKQNGLRGHIVEPLGMHGYMKCRFNNFINQSDLVCMHLYKRVFPVWYPPTWGEPLKAGDD